MYLDTRFEALDLKLCEVKVMRADHAGVCDNKQTPEKNTIRNNYKLSEHQIRGCMAVSPEGLQGKGSPRRMWSHRHRQEGSAGGAWSSASTRAGASATC